MQMKFRDLLANEIEARVAVCRNNGLSLLLYKDSRVDQRILDETVGAENWQKRFYEHKGTLFCSVGILCTHWVSVKDPVTGEIKELMAPEWVWKDDAGAPSNTEAAKGEASDAFKRACFNWGLGRELYTAPFIWVDAKHANIRADNGKARCFDHFRVAKIQIENKEITGVRIVNDSKGGEIAFSWKKQEAKNMNSR